MPSRSRQSSGRIRVHERNINDEAAVIGGEIELSAEHRADVVATEQRVMEDKTRREYRNRIKRIYEWLQGSADYPDYFEQGVRVLTAEEKADEVQFHHKNDHDLIYTGLNVKVIKAFLSEKKKKVKAADGSALVLASVSDVKKYDDAIKWGWLVAGQPLPSSYYREMDVQN